MSVFDASVVVDALEGVGPSGDAARHHLGDVEVLLAPAILSAEVTSALRHMVANHDLGERRASSWLRFANGDTPSSRS